MRHIFVERVGPAAWAPIDEALASVHEGRGGLGVTVGYGSLFTAGLAVGLLAMGAIGGGPTFVGTVIGHQFTSQPVSVLFLTLAAGSILYVVTQLVSLTAKTRRPDALAYGLLLGLFAGFLTDAIVTAAGA